MSPKVSVIIPAYNASSFLAKTIRSVQQQTFEDWEMIIVNDGSSDGTHDVAAQFLTDKRIRIIDQKNSGVSASRNNGAVISSGLYMAFLDADDIWLPFNLEEKVHYLSVHPEYGMVHADCQVIDGNGKNTGKILQGKDENTLQDLLLWNGTVVPGPSSVLVTRSAFQAVEGFDPAFSTAADQDFFFRIAHQFKVGRIDKILTAYRVHGENMHMNIAVMEKDHIGVYRKAARIHLFPSASFRRKCFSNLYMILAGSWWVNGKNKIRGMLFIFRSLITYPRNISKLLSKRK